MSKKTDFPNLRAGEWLHLSDPSLRYNCIAFAAGRTDVWWWPDPWPDPMNDYWPAGRTRRETVAALAELFRSFGYRPCRSARLEKGFEKVAIYAKGREPTHVAKQLEDGRWKSKLGPEEDIVHNSLENLQGPCYGKAVKFLKRPVQK